MKSTIITSVLHRMCRLRTLLPVALCGIYALSFVSCASMYVSSSEAHNRIIPWTKLPEKESGTEQSVAVFAQAATSDLYLHAISPESYSWTPSYLDYFVMGGVSTWFSGKTGPHSGWSTNLSASGYFTSVNVNTEDFIVNNSAYGASIQADALLIANYRGFFGQEYRSSIGPSLLWSIERGAWHDTRATLPTATNPQTISNEDGYTNFNMSPSGQSLSLGLHTESAFLMSKDVELAYGCGLHYILHDITFIEPFARNVSNLSEFYNYALYYGTYSFSQFMAIRTNSAQYTLQFTWPYNLYMPGNSSKFSLAIGTLFKL